MTDDRALPAIVDASPHTGLGAPHALPDAPPMTTDERATPMSDERLALIRARAAAATPGPWVADAVERWYVYRRSTPPRAGDGEIGECVVRLARDADAAFVAHARQDVPALLAEVERLRARDAALEAFVQAIAEAESFVGEWGDSLLNLRGDRLIAQARALLGVPHDE